jgi:2-beta-glucuronyltransferase
MSIDPLSTQSPRHNERFLVLSAHDFRSPRKAGIHFVTAELARRGLTRFFSLRYSLLSRYTDDPRLSLDDKANQVAVHQGVECYLWKTFIHPFNTRRPWLRPAENVMYRWYSRGRNRVLQQWIKEATTILMESGVAPVFYDLVKELNPNAKLVYRASDSLDAINVAEYVRQTFDRVAPDFNTIVLPSKALAETIPSTRNLAFIPQGIDHSMGQHNAPSPYPTGVHAVSVGSMLFDPTFFILAAKAFPDIHFHIIGSGHPRHSQYPANVTVYGEMPFEETVSYIKYASFGIAPYNNASLPNYLRDTSLKLIQYDFFNIPAVCPEFIAINYPTRFGYRIGDAESIKQAITQALNPQRPHNHRRVLNWGEVTERMLNPQAFSDTAMTAARPTVQEIPA